MMNNKRAGNVKEILDEFYRGGIELNCQLVLCHGWNDGEELDRTLRDLWEYNRMIDSIALVPVGLTKYREGLEIIEPFNKFSAGRVIDQVDRWQKKATTYLGRRFVYASDEFYILSGRDFPPYEYYDDFPQLDNGVGLVVKFEEELYNALEDTTSLDGVEGHITIATGMSAANFMKRWSAIIEEKMNIKIDVYPIENNFFGTSVTVAGLITASDIISTLKDKDLGIALLIPDVMLRQGEDVFLDDISLMELEKELDTKIASISKWIWWRQF